MKKITTETIYNHLNHSFWTNRKCSQCQHFFTLTDYQTQNYQLAFLAVFKAHHNHLEARVQLSHQQCLLANSLNYQSQMVYAQKK